MRKILLSCLICVLCALCASAQTYITDSVKIAGRYCAYTIYLPKDLPVEAPLVMCFHGYGRIAKPSRFDLDPVATREKFAVCYPHGIVDTTGHWGYNVGYPAQAALHNDEVSDMCKLTKAVQKRYGLSRINTFATGMSNGGDLCYLMAMKGQSTFRAMAPVSGVMCTWIYEKYDAPKPTPIYEIHGTADKTSRWDGDLDNRLGWGSYLSQKVSLGYWVARNKCTTETVDTVPGKDANNGHFVVQHRFTGGAADVWLDEIVGAIHSWHAQDIDTGERVWAFFKRYLKLQK